MLILPRLTPTPLPPAFPFFPGMREKSEYEELAGRLGDAVKGKVIIDATNPLTPYPGLEVLWNGNSGESCFGDIGIQI